MRKAVRAIILNNQSLLVMHRNKFGHQFVALVGGGIDNGETAEQALIREVHEETGITFANPKLVIIEDAGPIFGLQYIYLCDYQRGEPVLSPSSDEAQINALGQNLYLPMWLPISKLPDANLLPTELKKAILEGLVNGFNEEPLHLTIQA